MVNIKNVTKINKITNKFEYYDASKLLLEEEGYKVENFEEISWGLQFKISNGGNKHLLRVYEKKNGEINLDLSRIKNKQMEQKINKILQKLKDDKTEDIKIKNFQEKICINSIEEKEEIIKCLKKAGVKEEPSKHEHVEHLYTLGEAKISIFYRNVILIQGKNTSIAPEIYNVIKNINIDKDYAEKIYSMDIYVTIKNHMLGRNSNAC